MTIPSNQEFVTLNENKLIAEISELKSQVEDLQEELGNVLDVKNRQAWEIRLLKEEIKRLKRIKAEDAED